MSGPRSSRRAGRRPRQPPPRLATLSLPAMPDTCTLAAFTQMNSSAEFSRLPLAGRDEPGQPGPDRRPPCRGLRWPLRVRRQRGERQPLCPLSGACRLAACARSRPGSSAAPAAVSAPAAPTPATSTGQAYRGQVPGRTRPRGRSPALSVKSARSGQPVMIRQGPGTPARGQQPNWHDPRVRALTNARRSRGPGPRPGRLIRASGSARRLTHMPM